MNRFRQKVRSFGAQKSEGVEVPSGTYDLEEFFNIRVVKVIENTWERGASLDFLSAHMYEE